MANNRIYIAKDIVSAMFDKARPVVVYDNKDYFLKDIFQVIKGTDKGQKILNKVTGTINKATDPILDNALDKAVIKFRGELTPLLVILVLVLISNLVTIFKS